MDWAITRASLLDRVEVVGDALEMDGIVKMTISRSGPMGRPSLLIDARACSFRRRTVERISGFELGFIEMRSVVDVKKTASVILL